MKAKHLENNKKSSILYNQAISADDMNTAMNKIYEMEQKKMKKNPYKYRTTIILIQKRKMIQT